MAIVFDQTGYPICSTHGGDDDETAVAVLRNMLKHTSQKVSEHFRNYYVKDNEWEELKSGTTDWGIDYNVSCTRTLENTTTFTDRLLSDPVRWNPSRILLFPRQ